MKQLFLVAFAALCGSGSFAQQQKPTGGQSFHGTIDSIVTCDTVGPYYHLVNGNSYRVYIHAGVGGCGDDATGSLKLELGGEVVATIPDVLLSYYNGFFEITKLEANPLETQLKMTFNTNPGGIVNPYEWQLATVWVKVTDPDTVVITHTAPDSLTHTGLDSLHYTGSDELVVYPNPASGDLTIDGLKPAETSYGFILLDLQGRQVDVPNVSRTNSKVHVPTNGLPDGSYYIQLKTNQRAWRGKVQVMH